MSKRIFPINDWAPAQEAMMGLDQASGSTMTSRGRSHGPSSSSGESDDHRRRSLSLSLPWKRPKSVMMDLQELSSQSLSGSAIDDDGPEGLARPRPRGLSHGNAYHHSTSIKGIFRRASLSLRGMVHRRHPVVGEAITEEHPHASRPTTSHSTWNRIRHHATIRHSRSFYGLDFTHEPLPLRSQNTQPGGQFGRPGIGSEPPFIPHNTGAAAKASAALQNEALMQNSLQNIWLYPTTSEDGNDRESGIGITLTSADEPDPQISRIDFIAQLPGELAIHILAYLNATSLAKACLVSKAWNKAVDTQHIWRESCLRETTGTYATSLPVCPDSGQGLPNILPGNDWRQIYRVKRELDQRWKQGDVSAISLHGHTDSIYCLQFDEHKIITGSRDRTIRVWDMHTFECRLIIGPPEVISKPDLLDGEKGPVHFASTSEDSHSLSVSFPDTRAFDIYHQASILCLQYDDSILATGSSDSTCIVYDMHAGFKPLLRLRHHTAAVLDLAFDNKHIVTCSKDNTICVWDRLTGALVRQLTGHSGPVNAVQMRGNTIVSCSGDFLVKLWNIDTGKNIREFVGHTKGLACSQFSEDGRYVASAGNDKVIRIWDANTGECIREMRAHENLVRSLHIDSVSGRLISGSYDKDIKVWDMESGRELMKFPQWHQQYVLSAKSDYRRIVSSGQDQRVVIMDFGADVKGIELLESSVGSDMSFLSACK
ncbi:unnamed protein product [Clonostachys byssicola]|uniref:F-box domain-containing protein n=1 Tax=Clonostachys byssicola TaxID=160290 RepID=A0A9N9Y5H3_9HYPO|nr:unnamed protein product [Clonostachys byssicola]